MRASSVALSSAVFCISSAAFAQGGLFDSIRDKADGIKEAVSNFEMPSLIDIASDGTAKAVIAASDIMIAVSTEFSLMKPALEDYGFHIVNAKFRILPPSGYWCVVSLSTEEALNYKEVKAEGAFTKMVLYAALSAKKVQSALDLPIVSMEITIGDQTNINLNYYSNEDADLSKVSLSKLFSQICE